MRWCSFVFVLFGCGTTGSPGTTTTQTLTTTTTDDTATTTATTTGSTTSSTWTTFDPQFVRVDDAPAGTLWGGADVAIADDGTILVSWVDERTGDRAMQIARSDDGGDTWAASVTANTDGKPVAQPWTQPDLSIVGNTVGVAAMEWIGEPPVTRALGYTASMDDLVLGPSEMLATSNIEVASGGLDPNGDIWVVWIDYTLGAYVWVANPGNAYAGAPLLFDGFPGKACVCCPLDVAWTRAGEPMIAWRHNVDDIRNIAFTIGAPGGQTFSEAQIATDTDWYFVGCPADGPRLTEFLDETIALVWSDKSTGSDEVWIQTSSDKGATWTNEVAVAPDYTESKGNPVVHQLLDGTVYVGLQSTSSMPVVTSADGGQTWSAAAELITPDGPLDWIEFATGAGMSAVVGQTEAGTVWFKRLE